MKKLHTLGILMLMIVLLLAQTIYSCRSNFVEGLTAKKQVQPPPSGTTAQNGTVAYDPPTFGQFLTDLDNGNITNGGQWLYTPQPGQVQYTTVLANDSPPIQQAYDNQSSYTPTTPWSKVRQDAQTSTASNTTTGTAAAAAAAGVRPTMAKLPK